MGRRPFNLVMSHQNNRSSLHYTMLEPAMEMGRFITLYLGDSITSHMLIQMVIISLCKK